MLSNNQILLHWPLTRLTFFLNVGSFLFDISLDTFAFCGLIILWIERNLTFQGEGLKQSLHLRKGTSCYAYQAAIGWKSQSAWQWCILLPSLSPEEAFPGLSELSRAMFVCVVIPSALPSLSFFYLYLINYSLDPKAVKYSSSNYKYTPEKLLASAIWRASYCPRCPNLQSAIDVVWESLSDVCLLLVCTPQEQQVSWRPLGCFHKLEESLLQSGIPLWLGTFLRCPPASATLFSCSVLLK